MKVNRREEAWRKEDRFLPKDYVKKEEERAKEGYKIYEEK